MRVTESPSASKAPLLSLTSMGEEGSGVTLVLPAKQHEVNEKEDGGEAAERNQHYHECLRGRAVGFAQKPPPHKEHQHKECGKGDVKSSAEGAHENENSKCLSGNYLPTDFIIRSLMSILNAW